MKTEQYVAHRCSNEGIGVILHRDDETITAKFENGSVITSTPDLIIELTPQEIGAVRLDANNIRIANKRLKS